MSFISCWLMSFSKIDSTCTSTLLVRPVTISFSWGISWFMNFHNLWVFYLYLCKIASILSLFWLATFSLCSSSEIYFLYRCSIFYISRKVIVSSLLLDWVNLLDEANLCIDCDFCLRLYAGFRSMNEKCSISCNLLKGDSFPLLCLDYLYLILANWTL